MTNDEFISEPISPVRGTSDIRAMATGEPGLPFKFIWRHKEYTVERILDKGKDAAPSRSGRAAGGERSVSKHWYRILTTSGMEMKVYCERQYKARPRWWVQSIRRQSESAEQE